MPASTARKAPAFASATNPSSAEELLGKLCAYRPIEVRTVETRLGESEATIAQVVEITDDGKAIDLGERPVFWIVVRRQLAAATAEVPWIVGRLAQSGAAYRLEAITEADEPRVRQALAALAR